MDDQVLLRRTAFKGKHKIQDHWENMVYHVEGQPYSGLLVFKIFLVTGGGKVRDLLSNLILPFGGNIEGDPGNDKNQQDVDEPQDSISADSDSRGLEAEVVSTDPKPADEGDAIHMQHIQTGESLNYWTQIIWGWVKALYMNANNMKLSLEIHHWMFFWSICHNIALGEGGGPGTP